jgi:nucleoside-diphosphate-sugar epimerase
MNILFTGSSSFTGFWFVRTLRAAGHDLVCPLSGPVARYSGVRKRRFELLQGLCSALPDSPFGSKAFLDIITRAGPFDLLCHHGADVRNHRSPDFDPIAALRSNTLGLPSVLEQLRITGCRGVVLTGTIFEPDEGVGSRPLRAFSLYGLSKALTHHLFRFHCEQQKLPLGKFVIPNPFGAFEEERFTAYLCQTWREGKTPAVKTPEYVRDNIPVDLLAGAYRHFCEETALGHSPCLKLNPSGYKETQREFATRVAREVGARTGWKCTLDVQRQTDFSEPMVRVNSQSASALVPDWNEAAFWDGLAGYYS